MTYLMIPGRRFPLTTRRSTGLRLADTRGSRLMYTDSNQLKEVSRRGTELIEALFVSCLRLMHRRRVHGLHLPKPTHKGHSYFMSA
jgi:hypothetical protein